MTHRSQRLAPRTPGTNHHHYDGRAPKHPVVLFSGEPEVFQRFWVDGRGRTRWESVEVAR